MVTKRSTKIVLVTGGALWTARPSTNFVCPVGVAPPNDFLNTPLASFAVENSDDG